MADIVDAATRSRMMSGIRGKNTGPELWLRSALHRLGFRFRLHAKSVPGRPDLLLPKHRAAIFVHGCFWHGHQGCHYFRLPSSNASFWAGKIAANRERDERAKAHLREKGWRVLIVWECEIRGASRNPLLTESVAEWIRSSKVTGTIPEQPRSKRLT